MIIKFFRNFISLVKVTITSVFIFTTKKFFKNLKNTRQQKKLKKLKDLVIEYDNSDIEMFTEQFESAIQNDFKSIETEDLKTRNIAQNLYNNQINLLKLLNSLKIKLPKNLNKIHRGENYLTALSMSILTALSSLYMLISNIAPLLSNAKLNNTINEISKILLKSNNINILISALLFIISTIMAAVTIARNKTNSKQINLSIGLTIPDEEKDRILGKDFQKTIARLHSQVESISQSQSIKTTNDNEKLIRSILEIYSELYETNCINNFSNIKTNILPTMKYLIKNSLQYEIQDIYNDETKSNFTTQEIDGKSFVLQPAIINSKTKKIESLGIYAKGVN